MLPQGKQPISSRNDTFLADDIWARAGCYDVTSHPSHVAMALKPCDQVLSQCDKSKLEQVPGGARIPPAGPIS